MTTARRRSSAVSTRRAGRSARGASRSAVPARSRSAPRGRSRSDIRQGNGCRWQTTVPVCAPSQHRRGRSGRVFANGKELVVDRLDNEVRIAQFGPKEARRSWRIPSATPLGEVHSPSRSETRSSSCCASTPRRGTNSRCSCWTTEGWQRILGRCGGLGRDGTACALPSARPPALRSSARPPPASSSIATTWR